MGTEITVSQQDRAVSAKSDGGFASRDEKTLGGALIGEVRDLFGKPKTEAARQAQAAANDDYAHLIADTVAMLPKVRVVAAAGIRAAMLANPHEGIADNTVLGIFNAAGGAAMAALSRSQTARFLSSGKTAESLSIASEAKMNFGHGMGLGAIRSTFDERTWVDDKGNESVEAGLRKIAIATAVGGVANVPSAMVGNRAVRFLNPKLGESAIARVAVGTVTGSTSGAMFGAIDGTLRGGSALEIASSMKNGALLGAFTGGTLSGMPLMRSALFEKSSATPGNIAPETPPPQFKPVEPTVQKRALIGDGRFDTSTIKHLVAEHEPALGFKDTSSPERAAQNKIALPAPIETFVDRWHLPQGAPEKFPTTAEFVAALKIERVPALRYDLLTPEDAGSRKAFAFLPTRPDELRIIVPKDYVQQVEEARVKSAVSSNPSTSDLELSGRALPEDVLRSVLRVPDRARLGTITMRDGVSLDDLAKRHIEGLADAESLNWMTRADIAIKSGEVNLFQTTRKSVDESVLHEQVHRTQEGFEIEHQKEHVLNSPMPGDKSIDTYAMARDIDSPVEATEYGYSKSTESEAELESKVFLSGNLEKFFEGAETAPVRFSSIARRLSATINSAKPEHRSIDAQEILARANYVEKHVMPAAVDKVVDAIESGKAPDAAPLLGRLVFEPNAKANAILNDELAVGGKRMRIAATGLARMDWKGNVETLKNLSEEATSFHERMLLVDDMLDAQKSTEQAQALAVELSKAGPETRSYIEDSVFKQKHWFNSPEAIKLLDVPPEMSTASAAEKIRYVLNQEVPEWSTENELHSQVMHQKALALKMLRFNGDASDIPMLERLAIEERSRYNIPESSHDALAAAASLHSTIPQQQFDYLTGLALSKSELTDVATHVLTREGANYPNDWTSLPEAKPLSNALAPLHNHHMDLDVVARGLKEIADSASRQQWFDMIVPRFEQNNYIGSERNDVAFRRFADELADVPDLQSRITDSMRRLPRPDHDSPERVSTY